MARGYLGKISAVISANTGDYVRKLNESAKETRAFASTVQNTLGRASKDAAQSLNSIFTPLQKVERALRAAASQKLAFRGFDGAIRDVQSLQAAIAKLTDQRTIDLVVKTSGLGSLEELKRTINVLRNQDVTVGVDGLRQQRAAQQAAGANFIGPVTLQVKQEGDRLDAVIEALERIDAERIKQISIQVEDAQLTAATTQFRRLTELSTQIGAPLAKVQSEFSGLSGIVQAQFIPALAGAQTAYEQFQQRIKDNGAVTGAEFRDLTADVKVLEAAIGRLRETSAASGRLFSGEELTFVRPQVVDEFNKLAAAQQKLAAAPASVRGSPIARELLADGQVLKEQIDRISARIERLNSQGLDITVSQAGLDLAIRRLEEVRRLTDEISGSRAADNEIALLQRREQRAKELEQEQIAGAQRVADNEIALLQRREQAAKQLEERRLAEVQRAADNEIALLQRREQRAKELEQEQIAGAQRRAEVASTFLQVDQQGSDIASNEGRSVPLTGNRDPRTRVLNTLNQDIGDLRNRVAGVGDSLQRDIGPVVDVLTDKFRNLATSGVGFTAEQARRLAQEVASVNAALSARRATATSFGESFGGAGRAGLSLGVDEKSLRAIGGQIEFVQGRLAALAQEARGPVISALDALRTRAQQLFEGGALDTVEGRRELQLLREELVRTLSAAGGGSERRIAEQLRRVGDVARGSFGNAGLAIQQAAFAIEDFFSVTGGLDQRVRAAGNNISQLGFILGGTTGLILGVSVAIGAQLIAAFIKWSGVTKQAEDRQKALKAQVDALNSSLERQRSLVEQIASAYDSLAKSIAALGRSQAGGDRAARREQFRELEQSQRQRRAEIAEQTDQGLGGRRVRINQLQERLNEEADPIARRRIVAEIERLKRLIELQQRNFESDADAEIRRVQRNEAQFGIPAERQLRERRDRLSADADRAARVIEEVGAERAPRWVEQLAQITKALATIEVALQKLSDQRTRGGFETGFAIGDQLSRAQANVSLIQGFTFVEQFGNEFSDKLQSLLDDLAAADSEQLRDLLLNQINDLRGYSRALEDASVSISRFSDALEKAAGDLSRTVESELTSLSESLRRRANAAEAQFGAQDPRTVASRASVQQAEEARRRATQNRQQIEAEISRSRLRFEADALEGRGDPRAATIARRIRTLQERQADERQPVETRESARLEISRLQEELNRIFEQTRQVSELRRRADEGDIAAQRQVQEIESRQRGADLAATPSQRLREQLTQAREDINAFFDSQIDAIVEASDGLINEQDRVRIAEINRQREEAQARNREEQLRQAAPTIFGLADAVQNALLQGPSRAALQPTDVSTVEGSRELTRLLRGDDAARDQANLVELQKEANRLLDLIANNPANIAN